MAHRERVVAIALLLIGAPDCSSDADPDAAPATTATDDAGSDAAIPPGSDAGTDSGDALTGPGTEDCSNETDDDGDGAIDCADTDCAAYRCVAPPPPGWSGPSTRATAGACAAPYATPGPKGGIGLQGGAAACAACSCDPPTDVGCSGSATFKWMNSLCFEVSAKNPTVGTCTPDANPGGVLYANFDDTIAINGGSCAPKGGGVQSLPPAIHDSEVAICDLSASLGAGCSAFQACVAKSPGGTCVYKAGDEACPAGSAYSEKSLVVVDATDTRGCSDCTCGEPAGGFCAAELRTFSNGSCTSQTGSTATAVTCQAMGAFQAFKVVATSGPQGSISCEPHGGDPIGELTAKTVTTVCCMP